MTLNSSNMGSGPPSWEKGPPLGRDTHCPLLELPGELRNRIYREVLVAQTPIQVTDENYQQPDLLRTCSGIRSEASSLYYGENKFYLMVEEFDSTAVVSWYQHARNFGIGELNAFWDPEPGVRKWSNLLTWLRRAHEDAVPGFKMNPRTSALDRQSVAGQVALLFEQLNAMEDMPWSTVQRVLEIHRQAVVDCGRGEFFETADEDL